MKLTLLVPAYNEQENLKRFEKEVLPVMDMLEKKYSIVTELALVNDGSTDNSLDVMHELAKKDKRVDIISYLPNRGIGYALRTGIKELNSDFTVMLDSDLTFHPNDIPILMDVLGKADVILGSPFMKGGTTQVPVHRKMLTSIVAFMYRIVLGKKVKAVTPIFKLYNTDDLKELELDSDGFTIFAEMLSKLIFKKKTIKEVPVSLTTRIHGESKLKFTKEIKNNLKMMCKMLKWRF
ncbi:hypothetical protein CL614_06210 [archaeon]|nr:hypothetical protein [archaeon]|tara:strand:+ start:1609 stop:2316 length:708 start_codon:yes stop_codon:yes gene_type:complete